VKKSLLTLGLTSILLATTSIHANAQDFTEAQKAEINKMFEAYLMENGGKVLESVNKYQAELEQQAAAEAQDKAKAFMDKIATRSDLPVAGNPEGDVTLVEFFDYNCGYCSRALEEIQKVLTEDDNLKVVFVDMPILGPASFEVAKWSLAAANQDKYWEYHQAVMEHKGQKDESALIKIGKDLGLDTDQLKKDKEDPAVTAALNSNIEEARSMNIRGTPGFVIGNELSPGFIPAAEIKRIIAAQRAKQG